MSRVEKDGNQVSMTNPVGGQIIFRVGSAFVGNENVGLHVFMENETEIIDCLTLEEWDDVVASIRKLIVANRLEENARKFIADNIGKLVEIPVRSIEDYDPRDYRPVCLIKVRDCPLSKKCKHHDSAGDYRSEGGTEPGLVYHDGVWKCTKESSPIELEEAYNWDDPWRTGDQH